jgi:L-glutamine-phosphate cytidylyltransferase
VKTLVLLAAGQGTRLRPLTDNLPKCLVPVKGRPMLDQLLEHFEDWADQVVIVTGHAHQILEAHLGQLNSKVSIHTRYNPLYASTNSLFSAAMARDIWANSQEVILSNTDVVFSKDALTTLISATHKFTLSVEVKLCDDEDMKMMVTGNYVTRISKDLPNNQCLGEFTGLAKVQGDGIKKFAEAVEGLLRQPTMAAKGWYDLVFDALAKQEQTLWFATLPKESYAEIDTLEDLELAQAS